MWLKKSLLAKLLVGMLVAAVIPFMISVILSYRTTSASVERQVIELNQNAMESSIFYIKRYLNDLNHTSVTFYHDQTLMRYLRSKQSVSYQTLYITDQVAAVYNIRPEFRAVHYTSALTGETFIKSDISKMGADVPLIRQTIQSSGNEAWHDNQRFEVVSVEGESLLAYHKRIVDYPDSKVLGLLSLYVGTDEIGRLISPLYVSKTPESESAFLFIDQDFKLLYGSGTNASLEWQKGLARKMNGERGTFAGKINDRSGVFIYVKSSYMDVPLTMVKFVASSVINESANRTLNQSLAIQLMAVALVIVLASFLAYVLIAPLKRLVRSIAQVQLGNFEVKPVPIRMDELGVLEHRFQSMVRSLDDLMNREYRNRLELTTARLKMLQAQINPHFLYNTLQSIGTLALRNGSEEISDKIAELGTILRYSMDLETEIVPLQKEIEHIEHYLSLQTGRFKSKLSYTLSCPPGALQVQVPKMILQPLVENSIVHGIEKGTGSGVLHIGIELRPNRELCIRIIDNGKGISADTIERIRREYAGRKHVNDRQSGIGLINVLQRMRLRYEQGFDWEIESIPYEATVITLWLPLDHPA
ncbi:sensor histidine kinase [Paenibacillus beijingensis]|uniref:HAMP domain-containing protein n=1 Tax=Paenibacillus beijingensis TaxID=1126833 RepID=A0A0D5NG37_9BACL|nr:histidine kinase [Paenibacillus beijingensis]AJY74211.1 hypothetical protein VN24_06020 [Paenibacillus beijingensis]